MRPNTPSADRLINRYFPVLDHGFVALKDYMGTDACIERAARVSYGTGTRQTSDTTKLIRRLKKDVHTSPFEMVELKFHCAMPIFVARQWIRHRTANVNEYSGRYSKMPNLFYSPEPDQICHQDKKNKQGRSSMVDSRVSKEFISRLNDIRERSVENYEWALEADFSREIARIDLPLSTYTQWYWKIDLHNLMHFLKLRCEPAAQWEIRQFANVMAAILREVVPIAFKAWLDFQLNAVTFDAAEVFELQQAMADGRWPTPQTSPEFVDPRLTLMNKIRDWKQIVIPQISELSSYDSEVFEEKWK